MSEQDWPYGYEVVTARDTTGRNAVPTRVGLTQTRAGLVVTAECDGRVITFPIPDAARFVAAFNKAINQYARITGGGIGG